MTGRLPCFLSLDEARARASATAIVALILSRAFLHLLSGGQEDPSPFPDYVSTWKNYIGCGTRIRRTKGRKVYYLRRG